MSLGLTILLANEPHQVGESQLGEIRGGCYKTEQQTCVTPAQLGQTSCSVGPSCNAFVVGANCTQTALEGWYQWNANYNLAVAKAVGLDSSSVWEPDFCVVQKQCRCQFALGFFICVTQAAGKFGETNLQWDQMYTPSEAAGPDCPKPKS